MNPRRVALVCSGVGFVNRGFERLARDLFSELDGNVELTLFKGGGAPASNETVLRVPHRDGSHARVLGRQRAYELELAAYGARLYPRIRSGYDLVHYLEPYLGNVLAAARRRFGGGYALLLTDSLGLTFRSSSRADVVHVPTPLARDALIREGRPAGEVAMVPLGVHAERFAGGGSWTRAGRSDSSPDVVSCSRLRPSTAPTSGSTSSSRSSPGSTTGRCWS